MIKKKEKKISLKTKNKCFVIMPYGGWNDTYFEKIFQPAIIESGLDPIRADDLYGPSQIISDIWNFTKSSKLILADLSGKNPNVLYELGLAHAISQPVIMLTESEEDIPFDLRSLRIIKYDKNLPSWGLKLKKNIVKAIKEVLEKPMDYVPAYFLKVNKQDKDIAISERDKDIISLKQEIELLKRNMLSRQSNRISPDEARLLVRRYLEIGLPEDLIIERISRRGAPKEWVKRRIDEHNKIKDID